MMRTRHPYCQSVRASSATKFSVWTFPGQSHCCSSTVSLAIGVPLPSHRRLQRSPILQFCGRFWSECWLLMNMTMMQILMIGVHSGFAFQNYFVVSENYHHRTQQMIALIG